MDQHPVLRLQLTTVRAVRDDIESLEEAVRVHFADRSAVVDRLAREAVARVEESDNLPWQGDAWCELAEVLEAAGRRDAAIDAWREALDRYERKGIIPLARRVRRAHLNVQRARGVQQARSSAGAARKLRVWCGWAYGRPS